MTTLEWLFSCVLPHHVFFQFTSCNTGELAHCASVRLFSRVGSFVLLQMAWLNWRKVALIALVWFLSSVFHNVPSQMGNLIGWKVALCALVRFLPSVNEGVSLQMISLAKWLVALQTIEPLASTAQCAVCPLGCPCIHKCSVLYTEALRHLRHFQHDSSVSYTEFLYTIRLHI